MLIGCYLHKPPKAFVIALKHSLIGRGGAGSAPSPHPVPKDQKCLV